MIHEPQTAAIVAAGVSLVLGVGAGAFGLAKVGTSPRASYFAGLGALLFAFVTTGLGMAAMALAYREAMICVRECTDVYLPVEMLHDGYDEGRALALRGAAAAALPLLLGALATSLGAMRDREGAARERRVLAVLAISSAALTSILAIVAARRPWLGLDLPPDHPGWKIAGSAVALDGGADFGCSALDDGLRELWKPRTKSEFPRVFETDPHRYLPDLDARALACARRMMTGPLHARELDQILDAPIVMDPTIYEDARRAREKLP